MPSARIGAAHGAFPAAVEPRCSGVSASSAFSEFPRRPDSLRPAEMRPANDAVGIDHEEGPRRFAEIIMVGAVFLEHLTLGLEVRQEGKLQLAIRAEGEMAPHAVYRECRGGAARSDSANSSSISLYKRGA